MNFCRKSLYVDTQIDPFRHPSTPAARELDTFSPFHKSMQPESTLYIYGVKRQRHLSIER